MTTISFTPLASAPAHGKKPPKFSGADFKRWQHKMLFYLTTLNLSRFLKEDPPVVVEGDFDTQRRIAILNSLDDTLYSVYSSVKTAKELWDSLEKKYKTEYAGIKKFVVGKFLDFKMIDSKTVMNQLQKIQIILHDLLAEGMEINEPFQVASIIEKLPPQWKDFKNYLKHKHKELKPEDFIVRLRIDEDNRNTEAKSHKNMMETEAKKNLTESSMSHKRKHPHDGKRKGKAKKFQGSCYNCDKPNHMARDCRLQKKNNKNQKPKQANMIEQRYVPLAIYDIDLSVVICETNMVDNPREWWIDTGSTSHIYAKKDLYSTYATVGDRKLFMGNSATFEVVGVGNVVLKMTSGK
ncbi:uncharacterized protein [Henckelia pumila]|uniref:uncharacterized protein n=1 Tax=Henckelia pumila TaxID=405737 RepID=UPI003C6DC57F